MSAIDRHIETLQLARDCVALGARHHTLRTVTGLSDGVLTELFADQPQWRRSGRTPASTDVYLNNSLADRVEISLFANLFEEVFTDSSRPGRALVRAYSLYLDNCGVVPRLLFDVACMFASELRGLWLCEKPRLSLAYCPTCSLASVTAAGATFVANCPYCKIVERYPLDRRVRDHFPAGNTKARPPVGWHRLSGG